MDIRESVGAWRRTFRALRRSPAFFGASVLSLGIGVGICTAAFAVARATWFADPPYEEPARLVELWSTERPGSTRAFDAVPADRLRTWLQVEFRTLERLAAAAPLTLVLQEGMPRRVEAHAVTGAWFRTLGTPPRLGRTLGAADADPVAEPAVVLSETLWEEDFGGDPDVLGRTVRLSGESYVVAGVMPRRFERGRHAWVPADAPLEPGRPNAWFPVARLRGGASLEDAALEVGQRAAAELADDPTRHGGMGAVAIPVGAMERAASGSPWMLAGISGAVFLLALTNLSSLFLLRAVERARAWAIRTALGARRRQIAAELALESSVVALAGIGVALVVARLGAGVVGATGAGGSSTAAASLGGPELVIATSLGLLSAALAGLEPSRHMRSGDLGPLLQTGGPAATLGAAGRSSRKLILGTQIAIVVTLTCVGGAFALAHARLASLDLGYEVDGLVVAVPDYTVRPMTDDEQWALGEAVAGRLEGHGAVEDVGLWRMAGVRYPARPEWNAVFEGGATDLHVRSGLYRYYDVSPGFFRAMGIDIVAGRGFGPGDAAGSAPVGIVSAGGARAWWPGENPIGRRIKLGREGTWITVVGVAEDAADLHRLARAFSVGTITRSHQHLPLLYRPAAQRAAAPPGWVVDGTTLGFEGVVVAARSSADAKPASDALVAAVATLAPGLPLLHAGPLLEWQLDVGSAAERRANGRLVRSVGAAGILLALLGIFGLVADDVARRAREIGIRRALGAGGGDVRRVVVRQAWLVTLLGGAAGAAVVLALDQVMRSAFRVYLDWQLVGVRFTDPRVLAPALAIPLLAAAATAWTAARRAARIEPADALRAD